MSVRPSSARSYRPGDLAPVSGVYRITHLTGHRQPHEALLLRGEELPHCRICRASVEFEVVRMTSHTTHDWDFAGPSGWTLPAKRRGSSDVRAHSRCEIDLPISVKWKALAGDMAITGRTLDLGEGGVGAMLEGGIVNARLPVNIGIELPDQPPLVFTGELRYRKGRHCGFEFADPGPNERQMIRTLCAGTR
jgi:PilZ domain